MSDEAVTVTKIDPIRVFALGSIVLAIGTLGFYHLPGMMSETAEGDRAVNAFYCAAITLTTVGFGDICPGKMTLWGRVFLVCLLLMGLGIFGAVLEVFATWRHHIPGGYITMLSFVIGMGAAVFIALEGYSESEAIYASIITSTTIGYGDRAPATNSGKVAVALYAMLVVNVMALVLAPAREFLEGLCRVAVPTTEKQVNNEAKKQD